MFGSRRLIVHWWACESDQGREDSRGWNTKEVQEQATGGE